MVDQHLKILNQIFEIEKKIEHKPELNGLQRHVNRIKDQFEELGLIYTNPIGEPYSETRTDCEATIAGNSTNNLSIIEVIKPIISLKEGAFSTIVQKGLVIVEGK